jgi:hypothetical protein
MDTRILDLFIKENSEWDDMILRRKSEIPVLEGMLKDVVSESSEMEDHVLSSIGLLSREMKVQDTNLGAVSQELAMQKDFLSKQKKYPDDKDHVIESLSRQNIIREHIRKVEKDFIELKCNLLNYISTLLQYPHQISKSF